MTALVRKLSGLPSPPSMAFCLSSAASDGCSCGLGKHSHAQLRGGREMKEKNVRGKLF